MSIRFHVSGTSVAFPDGVPDLPGTGFIFAGDGAGNAYRGAAYENVDFIGIELGFECLAEHVGLGDAPAHRHTIGFARFQLGDVAPSLLVELVRMPWTALEAVEAAQAAFEAAGFVVARCADQPGRIVNRLLRPYFNAVLRRLDDSLASAADMDATLRLGLGYPEGPVGLLERSGLAHHFDATTALHKAFGDSDFAPARRAQVAHARAGR